MATRAAGINPATQRKDPNILKVSDGVDGIKHGMTDSQVLASVVTRSGLSAPTLKAFGNVSDKLALPDLMDQLRAAGDEVVNGDMNRMERMLAYQAITLDAMFNTLAKRSSHQEYMKNMETYMRLALKSQAQARATVEALALLKNPQPYIRQANIAQGNQQVNNGTATGRDSKAEHYAPARTRAEELSSSPNKLLEEDHAKRLDTRTKGAAGAANPHLEAVGAGQRPAHA
jgi:hypothetical protein